MFMAAKNRTAFISQRPPPPFPSFPRFLSPFGSRTSIHHHWVVEVWRRWHRHLPRLLTNVANPGAETNIAGWKNPTILRKHGGIIHGVFSRVYRRVLSTLAQHVAFGFAEGWGGDYDYLEKLCGWIEHEFRKRTCYKVCYQRDHIDNVDCDLEKQKTTADCAWFLGVLCMEIPGCWGQWWAGNVNVFKRFSWFALRQRKHCTHGLKNTSQRDTRWNIVLYLDQVGDWLQWNTITKMENDHRI